MKALAKILAAGLLALPIIGMASCGKEADPLEITHSVKLDKSYEGKNFIDDGIGKASVISYVDGDTTIFNLDNQSKDGISSVTIRYYNINTPESTGSVEKWGKSASLYNKEMLSSATEIVLEATTTPASVDSYGSRYLGYVWYRSSSSEDFVNLNLQLVEVGFSNSTAAATDKYYDSFKNAQAAATEKGLHIHSNEDDPNYNDKAVEVTVQEIVEDLASDSPTLYNVEEGTGTKVTFTAYIKSKTVVTSSGIYYFDAEALGTDGKPYTINLYAGYNSDIITGAMHVGQYWNIVGSVGTHNGSYQISIGHTYVVGETTENNSYILQKDYYVIFNSSHSLYSTANETAVRSNLTITKVSLVDNKLTIIGTASGVADNGITKKDAAERTYTLTVSLKEYKNYNPTTLTVGKSISVSGIQDTYNSNNITVLESTLSGYLTK